MKYIFYSVLFIFIIYIFLPKKNIYYYAVNNLHNQKISLTHSLIKTKFTGLFLEDVKFKYLDIKFSMSDNIEIKSYIFKSSITINETNMNGLFTRVMPMNIKQIKLIHSIVDFTKIYISSVFDGGVMRGYIDLSSKKVFLKVRISKYFEKRYTNIMRKLKKDELNHYYTYEVKF